jgi:homopolymeric O-antigen transport system permease protein
MVRYRQTVLGAAWTILQPVLLMLVFTVFFGLFARTPTQGVPFAVFYLLGLVPWQVVSRILNEGSGSVVSNAGLLNRVYFPRVYYPAAVALASLADLLFGLVALAVVLVIFRTAPGAQIVVLPVFVAVALATSLGLALVFSALNAAYRDIAQLLPSLTQLFFFASPILYPSAIVPAQYRLLYHLNPIALVIDGFRWIFAGTPAPAPEYWVAGISMATLMLSGGYLFFRHREPTFADVV